MSSSVIDFDELYEEFLALTSSCDSSLHLPGSVHQVPEYGSYQFPRSGEPGHSYDLDTGDMNRNPKNLGHPSGSPPEYHPPWMPSYRDYWGQRGDAPYSESQVSVIDPYAYPTGIEVVFRKLPVDCQAVLRHSDIPSGARERGYFTVAELLTLKRTIVCRYTGGDYPRIPTEPKITLRRGLKRGHEGEICEQVSVIRSTSSITGVGGVVKEAMKVLDDQQSNRQ